MTTPDRHPNDDQPPAMPRACRPLFNALVDVVLPLPHASMDLSISLASADPATARLLRDHIEARGDDVGRLFRGVLNVLRPMVARIEARRLVDEIENHEDEKMSHDAEVILARVEGSDAEKSRCEPVNPDAGHKPQWVWIPARKRPTEGVFSQS